MDGRGRPRAQAQRHVLAGHRRRVRRRAEGDAPARARADLPQLGRLVLHVRRELQEQVQPLARPPVPLRQGPRRLHVQRRRDPRPLGPAAGLRRLAGRIPPAGCPTTPGSSARRTCPTASSRTKTPGTFPASAARSRSGPAGTAARCPSNCWAGSSARAATRASWCSIRSAAAARRWPWPRSSGGGSSASSSRAEYAERVEHRLARIAPGDPLDGAAEPLVSAPNTANGRKLEDVQTGDRSATQDEPSATSTANPTRHSSHGSTDHEIRHLQRDLPGLAVRQGASPSPPSAATRASRSRRSRSPPTPARSPRPSAAEVRRQAEAAGLEVVGLHWLLGQDRGLLPDQPRRRGPPPHGRVPRASWPGCAATWADRIMVFGSPQQRNLLPGVTPEQAHGLRRRGRSRESCRCWRRPA